MSQQPIYFSALTSMVNYVSGVSTSNIFVRSFGVGMLDDIAVTGEDSYPRIYLEEPFQGFYTKLPDGRTAPYLTWSFALLAMNITQQDRSDELYQQSFMFDILNQIFQKFRDDKASNTTSFYLDDDINFISLREFNDDYTAGFRAEVTMREAIPMNRCTINQFFTGSTS